MFCQTERITQKQYLHAPTTMKVERSTRNVIKKFKITIDNIDSGIFTKTQMEITCIKVISNMTDTKT